MKILTFQHKNILKELEYDGVYIAKLDSFYKQKTPQCYDIVFNSIKTIEPGSTQPIFGWYSVLSNNNGELNIDSKTISRCLEMTGFNEENYLVFELDLPSDRVSLQNFYNFVDARCEEEGIDSYYDNFEDFPIDKIFDIKNALEIQCTFSSIHYPDIKNIYSFKKENNSYLLEKIYNS